MMQLAQRFRIRDARVVASHFDEILRLCAGKRVLHLGCADSPYTAERGTDLLHCRLATVTEPERLWGLDTCEKGVSILRDMGFENVIHGDAEQMGEMLRAKAFDVVLAGEVIEHVANPGLFLQSLVSIMSEETELILTTINGFYFKGFLNTMMRIEKVHPDHNYYFSNRTLVQLLGKFGLRCDEIYYYTEPGSNLPWKIIGKVIGIFTWISPAWSDGLIVRARRDRR